MEDNSDSIFFLQSVVFRLCLALRNIISLQRPLGDCFMNLSAAQKFVSACWDTFFFFFFKFSHPVWSLQLLQPNMLYFFFVKQLGQQYRGLIFVSCSEITFNANVVKFILVSYKLADPANITNLLPVPISDGISLSVNSYQAIIKSVSICHCLRWHSLQCYSLKSFVVKAFIRVVHKTFSRVLWAP